MSKDEVQNLSDEDLLKEWEKMKQTYKLRLPQNLSYQESNILFTDFVNVSSEINRRYHTSDKVEPKSAGVWVNEIKKIRDYFGEHDKTPFEHWAYRFLDTLGKRLDGSVGSDFVTSPEQPSPPVATLACTSGSSVEQDWKAKYEKCIDVIKRFDAGIIGMYDL